MPTRRNHRVASPIRASFRSFSPPQNCSLPLPLAAITVLPLRRCSDAVCSHASHACAAGRHLLRLSMYARRFAPNAHASLRICLPAHAARTLYCSHASRASTGGSIGTLRACARPVDNDSVSACAPGAACPAPTLRCVVIFLRTGFSASYLLRLGMSNGRSHAFLHRAAGRQHFVSLCRYKCCALFSSQLAPLLSPCTMDQRFSLRPICHASLRRYLPCGNGSALVTDS